jgi:hypothetical protein
MSGRSESSIDAIWHLEKARWANRERALACAGVYFLCGRHLNIELHQESITTAQIALPHTQFFAGVLELDTPPIRVCNRQPSPREGCPSLHTTPPIHLRSPSLTSTRGLHIRMDKIVKPAVPIVREYMSSHKVGVVVSAGKMSKAVKVRIAGQEWNKKIRKVCNIANVQAGIYMVVSRPDKGLTFAIVFA